MYQYNRTLWRDYYIQPSKNEITVIPKTTKNHSSYTQGPKLTIFNSFRGLELPNGTVSYLQEKRINKISLNLFCIFIFTK